MLHRIHSLSRPRRRSSAGNVLACLASACLLLVAGRAGWAQTYTQNFDGIANNAHVSTISGWADLIGSGQFGTNTNTYGGTGISIRGAVANDTVVYQGAGTASNQQLLIYGRASSTAHEIPILCASDASNYYKFIPPTGGGTAISIVKVSGGSSTTLATGNAGVTVTSANYYAIECKKSGNVLQMRVYTIGSSPSTWDLSYTDGSPLPAGYPGVMVDTGAASVIWDNFTYTALSLGVADVTFGSVGSTTLTVSTTGATNGTSPYTYQFQRSPDNGSNAPTGVWTNVGGNASATSQNDTGLTSNTTYWYRVTATDSAGSPATATSNPVSVTTTAGALTAQGVTFSSVSTTTLTVSSTAATGGTAPYTYQYQVAPDVAGAPGTWANTGSAQTGVSAGVTPNSRNETSLTPSQTYWYRIVVTDSAGSPATANGTASSVTTLAAAALIPGVLSLGTVGDASVGLSWTAATSGVGPYTYRVYRGTDPAAITTALGSPQSGTTYTDTTAVNGTPYYYKVQVTDSAGTPATALTNLVAATPHKTLYLCAIGDSWLITTTAAANGSTGTNNPTGSAGALLPYALEALHSDATKISYLNQGVGGTNGANWAPGSSNLNNAKAAMAAAHNVPGDWIVFVHLGINDSSQSFSSPSGGETASQYQAYMQAIATELKTVWGAKQVIFSGPPYIGPISTNHTEAGVQRMYAYQAALDAVAAATSGVSAAHLEYPYILSHQSDLGADGVHPTPSSGGTAGALNVANLWASELYGALYATPVADPVISPNGGTLTPPATVSISSATAGASFLVTLDSSDPRTSATAIPYASPFTLTTNAVVKAWAYRSGSPSSNVTTSSAFSIPQAATPAITPATGSYATSSQTVSITSATAGTIRYTLNGSTPTAQNGTIYSGPFTTGKTVNVQAICSAPGYRDSAVASSTITLPTPLQWTDALDGSISVQQYFESILALDASNYAATAINGSSQQTVTYTIYGGASAIVTATLTYDGTDKFVLSRVNVLGSPTTTLAGPVSLTSVLSNGMTLAKLLKVDLALRAGKFTKLGGTFSYFAQDGSTVLATSTTTTQTDGSASRTLVIN
jgi:hypothetical protein